MAEAAKTETPKKPVTDAVDRVVRQLEPSRVAVGEHIRQVLVITAFDDTKPEDLLAPSYWAHVTNKFQPWDMVEARANDGTWWAEYLVLAVDRTFMRVAMLRKASLTTSDVAQSQAGMPQDYKVLHRGPHSQWSVIRLSDNAVIHEGAKLEEDAQSWLRAHLKAFR